MVGGLLALHLTHGLAKCIALRQTAVKNNV
jgi:hypothetical protein